jgi:N-glycosylase/DNA lyase
LTVDELKRIYQAKRSLIKKKLSEFRRIGRNASDEKLFEELTFCIFTAGASARMGLSAVEGLRGVLVDSTMSEIQLALRHRHRFPNARGSHVYRTREYLRAHCGLKMRDLLDSFATAEERRDFFALSPDVRGLWYKEASHFLRNVGYRGYAILDKHVLGRLAEFGVVDSPKPASTRAQYLGLETRMKCFAESIEIDFDELDLLLWYTKTGEILK